MEQHSAGGSSDSHKVSVKFALDAIVDFFFVFVFVFVPPCWRTCTDWLILV